MPSIRLTVQTLTPLLMFGADNKHPTAVPELRATSVRGVLRYWLRAVLGVRYPSSADLYTAESAILGSTEQGSRVGVRIYPSRSLETEGRLRVMPERIPSDGFAAEGEFRITLTTHPLDASDVLYGDVLKAVYLLAHFGGLGKRARRGSGNLRVLEARNAEFENIPPLANVSASGDELIRYLNEVSNYITPDAGQLNRRPSHPVFAPNTTAVLVSPTGYATYQEAFDQLWRVSGPYHHQGGVFGDVNPRRASAIHMRVGISREGYHPQVTVMYAGYGDWQTMRSFIETCQFEGWIAAYGDWSNWQ